MRAFFVLCSLGLSVCLPFGAQAAPATSASLCTPEETVIFACPLKGKELVSLCVSKEYSPDKGYMQLRKGTNDKGSTANMTLPAAKTVPSKAAKGGTWMFAGGGGAYVQFADGNTSYTVYAATGKWGKGGKTVSMEGVATHKGSNVTDQRCTAEYAGEFGPSFIDESGMPTLEPEFELPEY